MPLSRRILTLACLALPLAAGCHDKKGTTEPSLPFTGTFALQSIDGQPQLQIGSGFGSTTRITSGSVVVRSDGKVIDVLTKQVFAGSTPQGAPTSDSVEMQSRRLGQTLLIDRPGALGSTDTLSLQEQDFLIVRGTLRIHLLAGTSVRSQHVGTYVRQATR